MTTQARCWGLNMRVRRWLLVTLVMVLSLTNYSLAIAGFKSGNDLYEQCEEGDETGDDSLVPFGVCYGYMQGVVDAHLGFMHAYACFQDNLENSRQLKDIVMNWSRANPQFRSMSGSDMVTISLFEAYPPKIKWRNPVQFDDDYNVTPAYFSSFKGDDGQWVSYCSDTTWGDAMELWGWLNSLPEGLKKRHGRMMGELVVGPSN